MTTGSVDSGGTAAAQSGSLPCAIWLVLSIMLIGLAVTLSAGTDKFLCSALGAASLLGRDAPRRNPGRVGVSD
jgi:hypothetical protein